MIREVTSENLEDRSRLVRRSLSESPVGAWR